MTENDKHAAKISQSGPEYTGPTVNGSNYKPNVPVGSEKAANQQGSDKAPFASLKEK